MTEYVNPLPPLAVEEHERLVADIAANGIRVPVEVCAESGVVLDGMNRQKIAAELGIDAPTITVVGLTSTIERQAYALRANLNRRNLSREQRDALRETHQKPLAKAFADAGWTQEQIGAALGVPEGTVAYWLAGRTLGAKDSSEERSPKTPEPPKEKRTHKLTKTAKDQIWVMHTSGDATAQIAAEFGVSERTIRNVVSRRKGVEDQAAERAALTEIPLGDMIRVGDFRKVLADIADDSIDLVFTDPPYAKKYVPLYDDLARLAARVLKPGGSLLAYCGQHSLPEIANLMTRHLRWWWICGCYHENGIHASLPGIRAYVLWKPIIWLVKDGNASEQFVNDMIRRSAPDKAHHAWEQALAEPLHYIEKLCAAEGMVLDPFAGGGTTGVAAKQLGRAFVGAEIDPKTAAIASGRIQSAG